MTIGTSALSEELLSTLRIGRVQLGRSRKLIVQPGVEFVLRLRDYLEAHPCVLVATKLCARAKIHARAISLKPHMIGMAGNNVHLARKLWRPEIVDNVC